MNAEDCALSCNQWRGKEFVVLKSVSMVFCTSVAQVWNRGLLFFFKQTPELTTEGRRSQGVYETADWPVTTRNTFDRAKQAV